MKYAIKLTNTVQNSYNEQRSDGLLTEFDIHNDEYSDDHKIALFDTKGDALAAIEKLRFIDNPTLQVVEVTITEGVDLTIPRLYDEVNSAVASDFRSSIRLLGEYDEVNSAVASDFRESLRRVDLEGAYLGVDDAN